MRLMRTLPFSVLLGAAAIIFAGFSPSMASAQTIEGANSFLARVAEQGSSRVYRDWPYVWYGRNMAGQNCDAGCHYTSAQPVRLTAASAAQCVTTLTHAAPAGRQEGDFWHAPTASPTTVVLDWSKVTSVTKPESSPTRVYISGLNGRDAFGGIFLEFDTQELAGRAQTAMEFLRTSCDALGGTGF